MASLLKVSTEAGQDEAGFISPEDSGKEGNLGRKEEQLTPATSPNHNFPYRFTS